MKQATDNAGTGLLSRFTAINIDGRMFRSMAVASVLAILGTVPFVTWRVSLGLLLGGALALVNHHWLSNSAGVVLNVAANGVKPRIQVIQYLLRYLVVGTTVVLAYKLGVVSLAATIVGLSTFVAALFIEAFREAYLGIIHREETS